MADYKLMLKETVRFETVKGLVTTEDLFNMPLRKNNGFNLDEVAKAINANLKESETESFIPDDSEDYSITLERAKLEVVKDIIADKIAAERSIKKRKEIAEKKRKLLEILEAKREESLKTKTEEEILAEIKALEAEA